MITEPRIRKRRYVTVAGIVGVSLAAISFIILAALNGIIGTQAEIFFQALLDAISKIRIDSTFWIIVLSIGLACAIGFLFYLAWRIVRLQDKWENLEQTHNVLERAFNTEHNIVLLDDSLLRLLASWIPARNHETEMKAILAELLNDATREFNGHVHRASILCPDGDFLKIWAHYGMPEESVRDIQFYIGPDSSRRRGIAGEAYKAQQLKVENLHETKNGWVCNNSDFTNGRRRPFPPYRTFVVLPIIGVSPTATTGNTTICLGVVCFDSLQPNIFDSAEIQQVLWVFARRIASALLIYEQLP